MPTITKHTQDLGTYVSLFDFLKKPAGEKLGLEVSTFARKINVPIKHRDIANSKYTGKVILYPYGFLLVYFDWKNRQPEDISSILNPDLPF